MTSDRLEILKGSRLVEARTLISRHPELVLAACFVAVIWYLSALRYWSYTDAWDMGGFVQTMWSASHGGLLEYTLNSFFYSSFPGQMVQSYLGTHFSPFLFLLVPLYAALPDPLTLIGVQSVVVALGLLPVFWLAKDELGSFAAYSLSAVYFLYPPLIGLALDNFHPETFIPTFFLFAVYFGMKRKWVWAAAGSVLLLSVIEEAGIAVAGMALFFAIRGKVWKDGWSAFRAGFLVLASLSYSVLASEARTSFGLNPGGFTSTLNSQNFSVLGVSSVYQLPQAILLTPARAAQALAYDVPGKISWVLVTYGPMLLTPFGALEALVMQATYLPVALFSNYPGYYSVYGIQQAFLIGSLFPAAVIAVKRARLSRGQSRVLMVAMVLFTLAFVPFVTFSPTVYGSSFQPGGVAKVESQMVSMVPPQASVLTTSDIFPHFANRLNAFVIPPPTLRPGYPSIDSEILGSITPPEYVMMNLGTGNGNVKAENGEIIQYVVAHPNYGVLAYSEGVVLFSLGFKGTPALESIPTFNATNLSFGPPASSGGSSIVFPQGGVSRVMWFGPYTFLPAGNYTATFVLETGSQPPQGSSPVIRVDVTSNLSNTILAERTLFPGDFQSGMARVVLRFSLQVPTFGLEFRGVYPSGKSTTILKDIEVASG